MNDHNRTSKNGHTSAAKCRLVYESSQAVYANQFVVHAGQEEVILDCSSGVLPAASGNEATLPIHTRLAVPWNAVARLEELLRQILAARATGPQIPPIGARGDGCSANGHSNGRAHLPPLDGAHG